MPAPTSKLNPLITNLKPHSRISESYRILRTNIQYSTVDSPLKTILVSSSQPGEGKSTTVSNLAVAYAQEEKRILLVDADLRKPTLHQIFSVTNRSGLTNVLANEQSLEDAVHSTEIPNLHLLTSGTYTPNPAEMLGSKRMNQLLDKVAQDYDLVLIDSPPIMAVTDAQILSTLCDGVIMVLNYGKVKRDVAKKALEQLAHVNAKVLGVVINNKTYTGKDSGYYYYYGS